MANKTINDLSPLTPSSTSLFAMYENGSTGKANVQQVLNTTIPGLGSTSGMSVKNAINGLVEDIEDIENLDFESQDTSQTPDAPIASTNISLLSGTDTWPQRFVKISQMFKNVRYLLNSLNTLIIKVEVPVSSVSVPANGMVLAAQCDSITGYTPISARFFGNSFTSTTVVPSSLFYQSSKNRVRFINTSSSAVTVNGTMIFYFIKSQFINS